MFQGINGRRLLSASFSVIVNNERAVNVGRTGAQLITQSGQNHDLALSRIGGHVKCCVATRSWAVALPDLFTPGGMLVSDWRHNVVLPS
jgi:hypothetical protein